VDAPLPFGDNEISFLEALVSEGVEFLVVGLSAALLQGAPGVTQDVDLWVGDLADPRFREALRKCGAIYVPPTPGTPPLIGGGGTDLFDLVSHMHGLGSFREEAARALRIQVGRVEVPVLPLDRIIASKKAAGRPKDLAILPALEDALRAQRERSES
jgi:hypothetical protein